MNELAKQFFRENLRLTKSDLLPIVLGGAAMAGVVFGKAYDVRQDALQSQDHVTYTVTEEDFRRGPRSIIENATGLINEQLEYYLEYLEVKIDSDEELGRSIYDSRPGDVINIPPFEFKG